MPSPDINKVIDDYILWLEDPQEFIDHEAAAALQDQLEASKSPAERLRLRAALRRAQEPPDLTPGFITHAKEWAEANSVSAEDFEAEGVPPAVLKRAGFSMKGKGSAKAPTRRRRSSSAALEAVRNYMRATKGSKVTVADIAEATGLHGTTTRDRLKDLIDQGQVKEDGTIDSKYGRAAVAYVWSGKEV